MLPLAGWLIGWDGIRQGRDIDGDQPIETNVSSQLIEHYRQSVLSFKVQCKHRFMK